jgi:L-ascorbate metabolism protein UlaG (beta-lactamase superfamily)
VGIEWVGHSTVVVDLDGVKLVTDPLLRNRVAHLRRAVPVDAGALRGLDAALISHAHYDHLDLPSLDRLGKKLPVVVPRGLGALLRRRRFEHVVEIGVGESVHVGSVEVRAVQAEHEAWRGPFTATAPSLGYVVSGSQSVYFAGDTDLFPEMAEIQPVDVALVPIWGWGPSLPEGAGHLDPRRAAEALGLLRAPLAVPIHWGTYYPIQLGLRKAPSFLEKPAAEFLLAARELAPDVEIRVLKPGERLDFATAP